MGFYLNYVRYIYKRRKCKNWVVIYDYYLDKYVVNFLYKNVRF